MYFHVCCGFVNRTILHCRVGWQLVCKVTASRQKGASEWVQARGSHLHNPRSLLLSRAVLARFTHTGLSWLAAGRAGEPSSGFLFLLASLAAFLGVLLALAGSSSDTSPLLACCFPFFLASPPFLLAAALDATCLLGGFLLLGDGPLACHRGNTSWALCS